MTTNDELEVLRAQVAERDAALRAVLAACERTDTEWDPLNEWEALVDDVRAAATLTTTSTVVLVRCCTAAEEIDGTYLVEGHTHCTCGAGGPVGHEPGCGLVPLVDLRGLPGWDGLVAAVKGCDQ